MEGFDKIIVKHLFTNREYNNVVLPNLELDYFDYNIQEILKAFKDFTNEYNKTPTFDNVRYIVSNNRKIHLKQREEVEKLIDDIEKVEFEYKSIEWFLDVTEKYFKIEACKNIIREGADILGNPDRFKDIDSLPDRMLDACRVNFDNNIGTIWGTDEAIENQYDYYHNPETRIPFPDWPFFSNILRGGAKRKALHLLIGKTNIGKTTWLSNIAIQYLKQGLNVLYITLEIDENEVSERVDGNLLDTKTDELVLLNKSQYVEKVKKIKSAFKGESVFKLCPSGSINSSHIKRMLNECEWKKDIKIDVLIIDYLNLLGSIRYKQMSNEYSMFKVVTEELKGICQERNLIGWTVTQFNRQGMRSDSPEMEDISDSIGVTFGMDFIGSIQQPDNLKEEGKQIVRVHKTRSKAVIPNKNDTWIVNVDMDKQIITEPENPTEGLMVGDKTLPLVPVKVQVTKPTLEEPTKSNSLRELNI